MSANAFRQASHSSRFTQTTALASPWRPVYFTAPGIDRPFNPPDISLADALADSRARFVPVHKGNSTFTQGESKGQLNALILTNMEAAALLEKHGGGGNEQQQQQQQQQRQEAVIVILLGTTQQKEPYYALDLSGLQDFVPPDGWIMKNLRGASLAMSDEQEASLLSTSRGIAAWHRSTVFCSSCGARMLAQKAGTSRKCTSCGITQYPRQDPAIITLVTCGDYALLGRKAAWNSGRYSTLAGFCEMGESIEETVHREVMEESGVSVDLSTLRFIASQPWLFPASLMIGFQVEAAKPAGDESPPTPTPTPSPSPCPSPLDAKLGELPIVEGGSLPAVSYGGHYTAAGKGHVWLPSVHVDMEEMEDVRWFHRSFIRQRFDVFDRPGEAPTGFHLPGKIALARRLIHDWILGEMDAKESGIDAACSEKEVPIRYGGID